MPRLSSAFAPDKLSPPPSTFVFSDTPWLGGHHDELSLMSFEDYVTLCGDPCDNYAARFQCIYTFGFLEGVMEVKVPESALLNADRTMMTGARFPALLQTWRDRILALGSSEANRAWAERTTRTIEWAYRLLEFDVFQSQVLYCGISISDLSSILSTITCIAEAICNSRAAFPSVEMCPTGVGVNWSRFQDLTGQRKQCMVNAGWCPFLIGSIEGSCALQYASTRAPLHGDVQYAHDVCDSTNCAVNTVDTTTYRNRHIPGCGGCQNLGPLVDGVTKLLENHEVPVLRVQHNDDGSLTMTSVSFRSIPYIAISHVWSDGLGSTTEAGLPSCQVRRLAELVGKVLPDGHFWIDALCVPQRRDMRKRAIALMADTYRCADMVLVIDSGIRTCSIYAPLEDTLLRIITSGWMHRLWTLQEALLANKLAFELLDGIIDVMDLTMPTGRFFNTLHLFLAKEVFRLRSYQKATANLGLAHVARALRRRSTSRAEDEILAICGLVGINATELVDLPREERMKTFLIRIGVFPKDIIFLRAPKLNQDNFRWAPGTFMTKANSLSFETNETALAKCTSDGLFATYFVVFFDKTTIQKDAPWFISHGAQDLLLKVWSLPMSEDDNPIPYYDCNALLFMERPALGEACACIAVSAALSMALLVALSVVPLMEQVENLFEFKYRMRLLALRIGDLKMRQATTPITKAICAGKMRVHMV